MDHIPTPKIDRNSAVEAAARMKDVTERAKAVHPVAQGGDILRHPFDVHAIDCSTPMNALRDIL